MNTVEIIPVTTGKEFRAFIDLPWNIYAGDPNWVPPLKYLVRRQLDFKRHPFWKHADGVLFLAKRHDEITGRISVQVDHAYNAHWGEQVGSFGFFECSNDRETSAALLNTAAAWLKKRDMNVMRGPMSPSSNGIYGLLIEGFNSPPAFMMPYNPRYYPDLIEQAGFRKVKELWAYSKQADRPLPDSALNVSRRLMRNPDITIRRITRKTLTDDFEVIRELYNMCWSDNWGFTPVSREEAREFADAVKYFGREEIALLAYWKDKPVGLYIALPDMNQVIVNMNGRLGITGLARLFINRKSIQRCRTLMIGIVKEFRKSGLVSCLYCEADRYLRNHYRELEFGWVLEDNIPAREMMEFVGGKVYKRYALYGREV
jgi:hypothetical protein